MPTYQLYSPDQAELLPANVKDVLGGELAMSYGVKQVGEPQSFRPMTLLRFVWAAARNS